MTTTEPVPAPPADPSPATPPDPAVPADPYVAWLLRNRSRSDVRSAIRRGDVPVTADRAYRYLARFWTGDGQGWRRDPVLLHAAAAATHLHVPHRPGVTLGDLAANLVSANVLSGDTVAARILTVQRMDLPAAHKHLSGLLHAAAQGRNGLDWASLFDLYRGWMQPNLEWRRTNRRRLLEQYHARRPG